MRKLFSLAGGLTLVFFSLPAHADFVAQYSFNGATIIVDYTTSTVLASGGASTSGSNFFFGNGIDTVTVSPTGTTGGFILGTFARSNGPNGSTDPAMSFNGFSINNQSGATAALTITLGDTGYRSPGLLPQTLLSNILVDTFNANRSNSTVGFASFLDTTNAQFGTGQMVYSGSINLGAASEQTNVNSTSVNVGIAPFSLTNVYTITLASGDGLHFLASNVLTSVPEPSTWLLLSVALGAMAARSLVSPTPVKHRLRR